VRVIYGFRLQHAMHIFRLLWCDEEQTVNVGVVNWVNNVLAILAQSNSNSLGYFVSQILEFGNSSNDMAKEKKSQSPIVCHNSFGKIKSWVHNMIFLSRKLFPRVFPRVCSRQNAAAVSSPSYRGSDR
jgi:hypothetical protein